MASNQAHRAASATARSTLQSSSSSSSARVTAGGGASPPTSTTTPAKCGLESFIPGGRKRSSLNLAGIIRRFSSSPSPPANAVPSQLTQLDEYADYPPSSGPPPPRAGHSGSSATNDTWQRTLERIAKAIVAIKINNPRSFDGASPSSGFATGFVVDKKRGLLLTNRHVVNGDGPMTGDGIFLNHEEAPLKPVYRDPIHDFAFCRYSPSDVKFMKVEEIPLHPEGAKVGTEIRVVGNDAGEKISILSGTISRVDREAPFYGVGHYNDHNISYIAAATSSSGGSSGSPIVDSAGRCVALNAGAAIQAASSFFLPLDRITRALKWIQSNLDEESGRDKSRAFTTTTSAAKGANGGGVLPRGTLQVVFRHRPFDEVKRLGLSSELERELRNAFLPEQITGALVVSRVIPGGPGHIVGLKEGDILLKINGKPIINFNDLEEELDEGASPGGKPMHLLIRRGNADMEFTTPVQSLWDIVPNEYVEYSGGIFHALGVQQSISYNVPVGSVYVSEAGYSASRAGINYGSIITRLGTVPVATLDDFVREISRYADGEKVLVRHVALSYKHVPSVSILTVDKKWFKMFRARREGPTGGGWVYEEVGGTPHTKTALAPSTSAVPLSSSSSTSSSSSSSISPVPALPDAKPLIRSQSLSRHLDADVPFPDVAKALVWVAFNTPFQLDGTREVQFAGTGVLIDREEGIILADRNTVVNMIADCQVTVGQTMELPARIVFLHPVLNFAFLKVDPALIPSDVKGLDLLRRAEERGGEIARGMRLTFLGLSMQQNVKVVPDIRVASVEKLFLGAPSIPRFSCKNFEVVNLDQSIGGTVGGVLADQTGAARALWSSFHINTEGRGNGGPDGAEAFYATLITPVVDALKNYKRVSALPPSREAVLANGIYTLGVEFSRMEMSEARLGFGLPVEWVERIANKTDRVHGRGVREVFTVDAVMAGTRAAKLFRTGDVVLAVDDIPLTSYVECDRQVMQAGGEGRGLRVTILRDSQVITLEEVKPVFLSGYGTSRIVYFAGCQLQATHDGVLWNGFVPQREAERENDESQLLDDRGAIPHERRPVFVSRISYGSPANSFGVQPLRWICEVNETPVRDLDEFFEAVKGFRHGDFVRLKLIDITGTPAVIALRVDLVFWKTSMLEFDFDAGVWKIREATPPTTTSGGGE